VTKSRLFQLIFIKETGILIIAIIVLWLAIGLLVDFNYSVENLKGYYGSIVRLDSILTITKDKPLYKEITKELQLKLDSYSKVFTLSTTRDFGYITSKIYVGDYVTIYTKPKLWGIFGLKKGSDINHLTKAEDIIIDYKDYKTSIAGLYLLPLLFAIILFFVYITKLRKRIWWEFGGFERYQEKIKVQ